MPGTFSAGTGSSAVGDRRPALDAEVEEVLVRDHPEPPGADRVGDGVGHGRRRAALGERLLDVVARDLVRRVVGAASRPISAGQLRSASRIRVRTQPGHSTLTPIGSPAAVTVLYSCSVIATTACLDAS